MKKAMLIVLAILVMATLAAAQDSSTAPTANLHGIATPWNVDGANGHVSHGCMLCHAPHSANAKISAAAVSPACFPATPPATNPACLTAGMGGFDPGNFPSGYSYTGAQAITSILTGFSGGPVAGQIYLWGTAITNQTYTTWEGTTINQGTISATNPTGSAVVHTLLCMSCHDNANSGYMMGSGFGTQTNNGTQFGVTDVAGPGQGYGEHIGLSTINSAGTGWQTGSSLQNTHPVDVQYVPGQTQALTGLPTNWKINTADGTFQDTTLFYLDATHVGHPAKLWVDAGSGLAMVECTTCHDPHRETAFAYWNGAGYTIGAAGSTIYYLRGPYSAPATTGNNGNINANFCRSCHYDKSEVYQNSSGAAN